MSGRKVFKFVIYKNSVFYIDELTWACRHQTGGCPEP